MSAPAYLERIVARGLRDAGDRHRHLRPTAPSPTAVVDDPFESEVPLQATPPPVPPSSPEQTATPATPSPPPSGPGPARQRPPLPVSEVPPAPQPTPPVAPDAVAHGSGPAPDTPTPARPLPPVEHAPPPLIESTPVAPAAVAPRPPAAVDVGEDDAETGREPTAQAPAQPREPDRVAVAVAGEPAPRALHRPQEAPDPVAVSDALARMDSLLRPEEQPAPAQTPPPSAPTVSIGRVRVEVVAPAPDVIRRPPAPRRAGRTASLGASPSKLRFGLGQV